MVLEEDLTEKRQENIEKLLLLYNEGVGGLMSGFSPQYWTCRNSNGSNYPTQTSDEDKKPYKVDDKKSPYECR